MHPRAGFRECISVHATCVDHGCQWLHNVCIEEALRELVANWHRLPAIRQRADRESGPERLNLVMRIRLPSVAPVDQTDARSGDFSKAAEVSSASGKWIDRPSARKLRFVRRLGVLTRVANLDAPLTGLHPQAEGWPPGERTTCAASSLDAGDTATGPRPPSPPLLTVFRSLKHRRFFAAESTFLDRVCSCV